MSKASKITLGLSCLISFSTIIGVHYVQELERQTLHGGPIKDAKRMEEKERKRNLNRNDHEMQQELKRKYESVQPLNGDIVSSDNKHED
ncbi:related to Protein PET117, mitochondrial [Saccharomycodes ludwigii]|uniref:Related to Protein PET117, mitochondrial n=1 Tax=Saccharomycodes ludwigii TaxID=36035 RepID=A0A376BA18_9ASCO|nr:hypothetical protein SCDLUD_000352 [Saccharomycodes ludwigii]KAH3902763.1 hypothetical protein SCDLUD_000352 [Saccharomycodes ludwigii]SSD61419.1 related to Protein PET117, mitochondrial [Saccharomycodes ludwigii]